MNQEKSFTEFEDFKLFNLNKVMGGVHIEDHATGSGATADSHASTVYDSMQEAHADGCDTLSCHDAEFDC